MLAHSDPKRRETLRASTPYKRQANNETQKCMDETPLFGEHNRNHQQWLRGAGFTPAATTQASIPSRG